MEKVIVVTGGGSGIGKAVVKALPKVYIVMIADCNEDRLQKIYDELTSQGYKIEIFKFDVSKREEVRALAKKAKELGKIERVINCAGISGAMGNPKKIISINALGTLHINQEFYEVMDNGVICDIASNSSYILPKIMLPSKRVFKLSLNNEEKFLRKCNRRSHLFPSKRLNSDVAYLISKTYIKWYAQRCAYKYMVTKNIRVFSISPGFVNTPMTELEKGKMTDAMLSYSPLNRGAEPSEIAALIINLSDPKCTYLIGSDVLCDGGCINNGYGIFTVIKKYNGRSKNEKW